MDDYAISRALRDSVAFNLRAIEHELSDYEALSSPTDIDGLRLKAISFYYAGLDRAATPLVRALAAVERTRRTLIKLAQLEARAGRFDSALEPLEEVLSETSADYQALELKSICLLGQGRFEDAEAAATNALAVTPGGARPTAVKAVIDGITQVPRQPATPTRLAEIAWQLIDGDPSIGLDADGLADIIVRVEPLWQ